MSTALRDKVVQEAEFVLAHGAHWKYYAIRPIPIQAIKAWTGTTDIKTDCSGSCIGIYARAGAPDPGGNGYDGIGNTDSLFANMEHIDYPDCLPADMVDVVGADGTEHVYLVLARTGGDLKVFSHGGPLGVPPKVEMLSAVKDYWYAKGYHFQGLRELATQPQYGWRVLNGTGRKIASTNHPAIWASRHPKSFRTYNIVKFKKN